MNPDVPLDGHLVFSDSLLKIFYRRRQYYATVRAIATMRQGVLRNVPINQLVSLAFLSSPKDLRLFGTDNPTLASLVFQKYISDGTNDLFHDWQLFCKLLDDPVQRSECLVGLLCLSIPISTLLTD